jgi:hypothetical protein
MKWFRMLTAAIAALIVGSASICAHAEKREQTYVKTGARTLSKTSMTLTEAPNHEITQEIQLQSSKYANPDFPLDEEWIYLHTDQTDGTGTHKGYYTYVMKGGDQAYGDFEGTHKTVSKPDGTWLTTWEGTYRYLGGTGKYKNIKGSGTYKGQVGAKEPYHEEGRERIEY